MFADAASSNCEKVVIGTKAATQVGVVLTLLGFLSLPVQADITSYRDSSGKLVFVNSNDTEMSSAAARGGAEAVREVLSQRKSKLGNIQEHLEKTAKEHNVDARLVEAMIEVESAWDPRAISSKGAQGLMQLMPATAKRFGVRNALDPSDNITGGIKYLRFLLDKFEDDVTLVLAGYNAGENAVVSYGGVPPYNETIDYVDRVKRIYDDLNADSRRAGGSIYSTVDRNGRLVYVNEND